MQLDVRQKRDQLRTEIARRLSVVWRAPLRIPVDEWADTFRNLPSETSAIQGRWDTSAFEVARGPMRACTEPGVRQMTGMASAQIFKTSSIENAVGREMHLNPGPILVFLAGDNAAGKFDSSKLEPMIKHTPELAELFGGPEKLEKQNPNFSKGKKIFPGGSVEVMTSDSVPNLRMRTARVAAFDECDAAKETSDGDTLSLIRDRLKVYKPNELLIVTSTPTETGASTIAAEYEDSDQRRPYVQCPCCQTWDFFRWENFVIPKDENGNFLPDQAHYNCNVCGHQWTDAERVLAVTTKGAISWRQTKRFTCCGETQDPDMSESWQFVDDQTLEPKDGPGPNRLGLAKCRHCGSTPVSRKNAGHWAWELYNPRTSFIDLAEAWSKTKGNPSKLRPFMNNILARTFARQVHAKTNVDPDSLSSRAEPPFAGVPEGDIVLTAGFDFQSGEENPRIEGEVVAWGPGLESWSLEYVVFDGDPREDSTWTALDEFIRRARMGVDGKAHYIQAAALDQGGHFAAETAAFTSTRQARRIWSVRGANELKGKARAPIWPRAASTKSKHRAPLYFIGTRSAKDQIFRLMEVTEPGPGYMHFPDNRPAGWYKQLTSEQLYTLHLPGGKVDTYWDKKPGHNRNEALDCRVYALAAFYGLKAQGLINKIAPIGAGVTPLEEAERNDRVESNGKRKKKRKPRSSTAGFGSPGW